MITHKAKCDICGAMKEVPTYSDWDCPQCGQGYTYDEGHQILLTDAQWALLRNQPRWIPVTERLPEYFIEVLVTNGRTHLLATCSKFAEHDTALWMSLAGPCYPTHWMPLPEPPPEFVSDRATSTR